MLPKISIIIPSFNKASYIKKTLESIFSQEYANLEVIIQDGGSTDGTVEIIKSFAKKNKIILESKKDGGQLDAVNKGLRKSTGEILTFINADDVYVKGAFKNVSDKYSENPNTLWFAGHGIVINKKDKEIAKSVTWYKNLLTKLNFRFFLLTTNYLMQPSVFFTRPAYDKYGPFTGTQNFIMEYDFWLKLSKVSMPYIITKDISKFRIEPTTKTKTLSRQLLHEDWKIVNKYTQNPVVLALHMLNNLGRLIVGRFV